MKISNTKKYLDLYNQEEFLFNIIGPAIRKRGFMKFDEFYQICMWKSARQKPKYLQNKKIIESISKEAFTDKDEVTKIKKLCDLRGVGIPTASAILTIVYPHKYGVIDIRCIEMLKKMGFDINKSINLKNWINYLEIVRNLGTENNLQPREIDKVLFAMHREMLEKNNYKNLYK